MSLGGPWLLLPLGWVLGVAGQLQQTALWPSSVYLLAILLGALLLTLAAWRPGWRASPVWLLAGMLCASGVTGSRAAIHAAQALPSALEGRDIRVNGRIASLPQTTPLGQRFELRVDSATLDGQPVVLPSRLQLSWFSAARGDASASASAPLLRAGETWRLTVRLRQPHGNRNPHGWDRERWLWEKGIGATGYVRSGPRDPEPQRVGQASGFSVLAARQWVAERIEARVDEPRSAGVLAALVVGDQSAIEREDWDLFRTTGVAHLMSISGLHVTMFAWLAVGLIGWGWRPLGLLRPGLLLAMPAPWAAGVGGVALAGAYALFSGWGVPAQRTVLMLGVVVALRLSARQWPWPLVWLLAMCAVLLLDPWAFLQPGFWLSFVAVGILFASDAGRRGAGLQAPEEPWAVRRAIRPALGLLREQAVVTVALAPLALLLFGQFSVVGLAANLIAIPWVTLLITPLAMLGVLLPPLWDLASLALQGLGLALQWLGQWPWAAIHRAIPPLPLALAAVLGGVLLVLRWPVVVRAAGLLLMVPALFWMPPRPPPGAFEVLAIDVGQGSAVLVRTAGHSLLFDAGPRYSPESDAGQRVILPLLRALGEQPDTVMISHRDSDHAGGADAVRAAWPQARWLSSYDPDPTQRCLAGQRWQWDGVDFEVLHPTPEHYRPDGSGLLSSNAMSCTLLIRDGRQAAWLSGDLDAERETRLALARPDLRATLMLAPHHGSRSSSSPVLLNTLNPRWVMVQSGYRNRFGHPAPEVLARYRERDLSWVTSPECGAATWRSHEPDRVLCERERGRRYWHHLSPRPSGGEPYEEAAPDPD